LKLLTYTKLNVIQVTFYTTQRGNGSQTYFTAHDAIVAAIIATIAARAAEDRTWRSWVSLALTFDPQE